MALPDPKQEVQSSAGPNRDIQSSVGTAGPQPQDPELNGHCRTPSGKSRAQWALPDPNRDIQSSVDPKPRHPNSMGTAGPQPQDPELSGHCRTQAGGPELSRTQPRHPELSGHCRTPTARSRAQWALPDPKREVQSSVATSGPQPRHPELSGPQPQHPELSGHCRTQAGGHCRTPSATSRAQWALPDPNRDIQISMGLMSNTIACQKECQKECEIEWQKRMSELNRMSEHICHIYILPDEMSETMTK